MRFSIVKYQYSCRENVSQNYNYLMVSFIQYYIKQKTLILLFLIEIFIEVSVDSHAVVKIILEYRCYERFSQFPPTLTFKTMVQCHNQDIGIDIIHQFYLHFLSFTHTHVCFCGAV